MWESYRRTPRQTREQRSRMTSNCGGPCCGNTTTKAVREQARESEEPSPNHYLGIDFVGLGPYNTELPKSQGFEEGKQASRAMLRARRRNQERSFPCNSRTLPR